MAAVLLLALVGAPALLASSAQAYPVISCSVSVSAQTVQSGHTFTATGSTPLAAHWTASFNGQRRVFDGTTFSTRFRAPVTQHDLTLPLRVRCVAAQGAQTQVIDIHVLGALGQTGSGSLPNTGGFSIWWLVAAIVVVVAGGGLMWGGRRRRTARG